MPVNGAQTRLPSDTFPGPLNEARAASTAAGGTAVTSTAQVVGIPNHTAHVSIVTHTYASSALVVKAALNPYLVLLKTTDNLATFANVTDYSVQGQQPGGTGVTLSSLDTLANGGAFYIGSHVPFRGVAVDMSAAVNGAASVLSAHYWTGALWTSLSPTDGTTAGGATFAQDGNITWTMPASGLWVADYLSNTVPAQVAAGSYLPAEQRSTLLPWNELKRYWARLTVSAALDSSTVANTMFALNRSTAYAEYITGSLLQFRVVKEPGGIACVELLTDTGIADVIVNCYTDPTENF